MDPRHRLAITVTAVALLFPAFAEAGGISLYEIATSDVGLASAGWAARAQDPATLLKNPAGMSRLEGNQFQGGAQLLYGSVGFSPGPGTTVAGVGQAAVAWPEQQVGVAGIADELGGELPHIEPEVVQALAGREAQLHQARGAGRLGMANQPILDC